MLRRLIDVPYEELRVGNRVKSLKSGRTGMIVGLIPEDDATIKIHWDGAPESYISYVYYNYAQYVALIAD